MQHVVLYGAEAADAKHVVRVRVTFRDLLAGFDMIAGLKFDAVPLGEVGAEGHQVSSGIARLIICHNDFTFLLRVADRDFAGDLGQDGDTLGVTRFEQFFDTRKTGRDVFTCDTAGMEGTERQLRTGFADGLCGNDADGLADLNRFAGRHVGAVALGADAEVRSAAEVRADLHGIPAALFEDGNDTVRGPGRDHVVFLNDELAIFIHNVFCGETADQTLAERFDDFAAVLEGADLHEGDLAVVRAVFFADDDVLGNVDQTAGQIT